MKRIVFILICLAGSAGLLAAQSAGPNEVVTDHYDVYSASGTQDAQAIGNELEAYAELFDSYFHFDPSTLSGKLKVRIYATKADFDNYLAKVIPGQRDSFVYLQYPDASRSVLVGYHMQDDAAFTRALIHHGFVQFLRSFVAQPPLWLQEGFAVYFEASEYDPAKNVAVFHPNLAWVGTLKDAIAQYVSSNDASAVIPLGTLLTMDTDAAMKQLTLFYAESWGLVSFLADSDLKEYNRILWDSITALAPGATVADNTTSIEKRAFAWISDTQFAADFGAYVQSVKTFPELVNDGMQAYAAGDLTASEQDFTKAIALDDKNNIPYYYLGLIKYAKKDYYLAEHYFQTSLQMGGDPGLVDYALGVNAFADNRIDDAKNYLQQAVATNSATYKGKAGSLLDRIVKQSAQ